MWRTERRHRRPSFCQRANGTWRLQRKTGAWSPEESSLPHVVTRSEPAALRQEASISKSPAEAGAQGLRASLHRLIGSYRNFPLQEEAPDAESGSAAPEAGKLTAYFEKVFVELLSGCHCRCSHAPSHAQLLSLKDVQTNNALCPLTLAAQTPHGTRGARPYHKTSTDLIHV